MDKVLWINLGIGMSIGAITLLSGTLNLPLSIATCFAVSAAMNMLMMARR